MNNNIIFERNEAMCNLLEDIKALDFLVNDKTVDDEDDVKTTEGECTNIHVKVRVWILVRLPGDDIPQCYWYRSYAK